MTTTQLLGSYPFVPAFAAAEAMMDSIRASIIVFFVPDAAGCGESGGSDAECVVRWGFEVGQNLSCVVWLHECLGTTTRFPRNVWPRLILTTVRGSAVFLCGLPSEKDLARLARSATVQDAAGVVNTLFPPNRRIVITRAHVISKDAFVQELRQARDAGNDVARLLLQLEWDAPDGVRT